ncbi:MAG: hydrogenase maturation protease [Isosphaeraceae bacterium]|nr:hydrogenase maturation protease [Isosphaeraceae bacterium]
MKPPRILVACIGNIFLGDDAFGVEVAQRLAQTGLPEGVRVVDFGIRGLDLAYALLDDHDAVVLVDATPRGGTPGTLYVLEPTLDGLPEDEPAAPAVEGHGMDPVKVLRLAASMGAKLERLRLVGCEPVPPASEHDMSMELSAPVRAAVDPAVVVIKEVVADLLANGASAVSNHHVTHAKGV